MMYHISTSIEGILSLSDYRLKKMLPFISVDGQPLQTVGQLKKGLRKELALGHLLIAAQGCDNFDPVKGCLGHEQKEDQKMTPLQMARLRQQEQQKKPSRHCSTCDKRVVIGNASYCEESGKLLHPRLVESGNGCPVDIRKEKGGK